MPGKQVRHAGPRTAPLPQPPSAGQLSLPVIKASHSSTITLLGAGGKEGQLLAVMLKRLPLVERLKLHGSEVVKPALDNENPDCIVKCFKGNESITDAVKGADVIVLHDDSTKKPLDKASFKQRAALIIEYASKIASANPKGVVVVAMSPVHLAVPVVSHVLGGEDRVLGVTGADSAHASAVLASHLQVSPSRVFLPVVGGSSPETRVPLFSKTKPYVSLPERVWQKLMGRMKCGVEREKQVAATARLVQALLSGGVETAFTRTDLISGVDYFSLPVVLGECTLQRRVPLSGPLLPLEEALLTQALVSLSTDTATVHALLNTHLSLPFSQSSDTIVQQEPLLHVKDAFQDELNICTGKENCTNLNTNESIHQLLAAKTKSLKQDNLIGITKELESTRCEEDTSHPGVRPTSRLLGVQKDQANTNHTAQLGNPPSESEVSRMNTLSLNPSLGTDCKNNDKSQFSSINYRVSNKCIKSDDSNALMADKGDSQRKNIYYEPCESKAHYVSPNIINHSNSFQENSNQINNAIRYCPFDMTFIRNEIEKNGSLSDKSPGKNTNLLKTKQNKPENGSGGTILNQVQPLNKGKINMESVEDYLKDFFSYKRNNTLNKKDTIINSNKVLKNTIHDNKRQCKKNHISGKLVTANDEKTDVKIMDQNPKMIHSDINVEKYQSKPSCFDSNASVYMDNKNAIINSTRQDKYYNDIILETPGKDKYYNDIILETPGKEVKIIKKDGGPTSTQELCNSIIKLPLNSDSIISEISRQDVISRKFFKKQKENVNSNLPCKEVLRFSSSEAFDKIDTLTYITKKRKHKLCTEDITNFFREKRYPEVSDKPLQSHEGPTAHILKKSHYEKVKLEKLKISNTYDDSLTKKIQERQRKLIVPVNSSSFGINETSNNHIHFHKKTNTFQTKKTDSLKFSSEQSNESTKKALKEEDNQTSMTLCQTHSNKSILRSPEGNKMGPINSDGKTQETHPPEEKCSRSGDNLIVKNAIPSACSSGREVPKEVEQVVRAPCPGCVNNSANVHSTPPDSSPIEDLTLLLPTPGGPK